MKHLPVYILFVCLAGLAFSCMGESEQQTIYQRLGVVQAQPAATVHTIDRYRITSPAFEGLSAGNCYRLDFKAILSDNPQGEIYNVDVLRMDTIPVWSFADAFTDTTVILDGEMRLKSIKVNKQNNYLDGRLFVYTTRDSFYLDEIERYELSYNWDEVKDRDANGNYIYDLFLRFTQSEGTDTIRAAGTLYANAFILDDFLRRASEKEQAAGKDSVIMRMNYVKGYNRDSTAWTWTASSDTFTLPVSTAR